MDPHSAATVILVLCLALVLVVFVLGVEVGKVSVLRAHPGYTAAGLPAPGGHARP